jgi:hypothetical protein
MDSQIGIDEIQKHELNQMIIPARFTHPFENNRFKWSWVDTKDSIDATVGAKCLSLISFHHSLNNTDPICQIYLVNLKLGIKAE